MSHVHIAPANHHLYCNKLSIDCLVQSENRKCGTHHDSDSGHYYLLTEQPNQLALLSGGVCVWGVWGVSVWANSKIDKNS